MNHREDDMKKFFITLLIAAGCTAPFAGRAQSEAASVMAAASMLPVASMIGGASAVAGSAVVAPMAVLASGAVLVVQSVELSARGTVYVLERASDGARVSVEIAGRTARGASMAAGTMVVCSVIGAGVVLSVAGEAIAFLPNALGQALLHNERLTN